MLRACLDHDCITAEIDPFESESLVDRARQWVVDEGPWWGCSFVIHLLFLCAIAAMGYREISESVDTGIFLKAPDRDDDSEAPEIAHLTIDPAVGHDTVDPPEQLHLENRPADAVPLVDSNDAAIPLRPGAAAGTGRDRADAIPGMPGGLSFVGIGFDPKLPGVRRPGGIGLLSGDPFRVGPRGPGGFPTRRPGAGDDHTRASVSRVAGALEWLARHQLRDGSWSLHAYVTCCKDATCTGPGSAVADSAATAMGLLPFLAGGQTHVSKGPYKMTVGAAVSWLVRHQKPDGDLRCGATMYAHGLATIALCEDYGMTGDRAVGYAAQRAVDFTQFAQNRSTGGWRYQPGDEGDLSVAGWQIMALKSAQMAGLQVDPAGLQRAKAYLAAVSSPPGSQGSSTGGRFSYVVGGPPTTAMTSVGLLCSQYLGAARNDLSMVEGTAQLLRNLPDRASRDLYYWYYATQVMHNQPGPDWDTWNRKMRKILVDTQSREGCAAGSWDPQNPSPDRWAAQGGRLMMTSLAALTLEVYYRYLPLYKLDGNGAGERKPF